MLRFRIMEILQEQGRTKWWLYKHMNMSYTNFDNLVRNRTRSIRFDTLEKLQKALGCSMDSLFEEIPDEPENSKRC